MAKLGIELCQSVKEYRKIPGQNGAKLKANRMEFPPAKKAAVPLRLGRKGLCHPCILRRLPFNCKRNEAIEEESPAQGPSSFRGKSPIPLSPAVGALKGEGARVRFARNRTDVCFACNTTPVCSCKDEPSVCFSQNKTSVCSSQYFSEGRTTGPQSGEARPAESAACRTGLKTYAKPLGAALACALLLVFPGPALEAALEAMSLWARAFAPALLPFFAVTPALCCPEAAALYERALGRGMEGLFGCPGRGAAPLAVGFMAGSPAGATALSRVKEGMTGAQATRTLLLSAGLSPAFLVASVGGAMLGDPALGRVLLQSQIGAVLLSGLLLRHAFRGQEKVVCGGESRSGWAEPPLRGAVAGVLTVCGWMVCFGVLARLILLAAGGLGPALLPLLEITGGCGQIAAWPLPGQVKLTVLGFFCGAGGLAVFLQNAAQVPEVKKRHLALGKLLHGMLCGLLTWVQTALPLPAAIPLTPSASLILACALPPVIALWLLAHRLTGHPRHNNRPLPPD